ncbi:glycosyl hydrolase [Streptomyces sp. NPDC004532]
MTSAAVCHGTAITGIRAARLPVRSHFTSSRPISPTIQPDGGQAPKEHAVDPNLRNSRRTATGSSVDLIAPTNIDSIVVAAGSAATAGSDPFGAPPASAEPHTWWHWMNGSVTDEGITRDLEAIAGTGLGGVSPRSQRPHVCPPRGQLQPRETLPLAQRLKRVTSNRHDGRDHRDHRHHHLHSGHPVSPRTPTSPYLLLDFGRPYIARSPAVRTNGPDTGLSLKASRNGTEFTPVATLTGGDPSVAGRPARPSPRSPPNRPHGSASSRRRAAANRNDLHTPHTLQHVTPCGLACDVRAIAAVRP